MPKFSSTHHHPRATSHFPVFAASVSCLSSPNELRVLTLVYLCYTLSIFSRTSRVVFLSDVAQQTNSKAIMSSISVQGDDDRHCSLSIMPPEVVTKIFCQLPSFPDVFALSAVCWRLRHLWLKNVNPVYNHIAPRSIPCERAARRFLIDQDGPGLGSPVSAKDVVRMVRNAGVIEKAILQFEREIVSRVRSKLDPNSHVVRSIGLISKCNSGWS